MEQIFKVSEIDTQLNENPYRQTYKTKCLERTKEIDNTLSDICDIRLLSSEFNRESLNSELATIQNISKELMNTIEQLESHGDTIFKNISYSTASKCLLNS